MASAAVGLTNVLGTLIAGTLIEATGRKTLLVGSYLGQVRWAWRHHVLTPRTVRLSAWSCLLNLTLLRPELVCCSTNPDTTSMAVHHFPTPPHTRPPPKPCVALCA